MPNAYTGKSAKTNQNLMVGTISPKYQFDNSGKSPKTNENLAKEDGMPNAYQPKTSEASYQIDYLAKPSQNQVCQMPT